MPTATFRPITAGLARQLIDKIDRRNLGKSFEIDGKIYTLDHISHNTNAFFQSRGLSVYFRTGRSVVRISDHWSRSIGNDRSRKLNCGSIGGKQWDAERQDHIWITREWVMGAATERLSCSTYAGRYPFVMLAGVCGLSSLNKTSEHWLG